MVVKICKKCGKPILDAYNTQKYHKICRKEVQKEQWYRYWVKNHPKTGRPHRPETSKCIKCKNIYEPTSSGQKYCIKCGKKHKIQYQKTYGDKYRHTEQGIYATRRATNKRRLRMNSVREEFTMKEWFKKVDDTEGVCPGYNKKPHFVSKINLTLDHIMPISKAPEGFVYGINDVQPLCRRCNSSKRAKITDTLSSNNTTFIKKDNNSNNEDEKDDTNKTEENTSTGTDTKKGKSN